MLTFLLVMCFLGFAVSRLVSFAKQVPADTAVETGSSLWKWLMKK